MDPRSRTRFLNAGDAAARARMRARVRTRVRDVGGEVNTCARGISVSP